MRRKPELNSEKLFWREQEVEPNNILSEPKQKLFWFETLVLKIQTLFLLKRSSPEMHRTCSAFEITSNETEFPVFLCRNGLMDKSFPYYLH